MSHMSKPLNISNLQIPRQHLYQYKAKIGYRDNVGLNHMCDVLKVYGFTDDEAEIFKRQYRGMNLAQTYDVVEGSGDETGRSLIKIGDFGGFSNYELSRQASQYDINLR